MSQYRKFLAALAGVLGVLAVVLQDGNVSGDEMGALVVALVTAYGVYRVPNTA
jgi:hypothetical protein